MTEHEQSKYNKQRTQKCMAVQLDVMADSGNITLTQQQRLLYFYLRPMDICHLSDQQLLEEILQLTEMVVQETETVNEQA